MMLHFRIPEFRVVRLKRRAAGWEVLAWSRGIRYRRYWMESDCPSRQKLRADFKAYPDAWIEVD